MAAKRISSQKNGVNHQNDRAYTDAKLAASEKAHDSIICQNHNKTEGDIECVAVQVLKNEERCFPFIFFSGDTRHSTGRWRQKIGSVIEFPVVIACHSERERTHENQNGG